MIGAFFIATIPSVPQPATPYGGLRHHYRLCIYGVRVWGSYLDAIAIAVIFEIFCTLLDHMLRPRIFGQISHRSGPAASGQALPRIRSMSRLSRIQDAPSQEGEQPNHHRVFRNQPTVGNQSEQHRRQCTRIQHRSGSALPAATVYGCGRLFVSSMFSSGSLPL